MPYLNKGLCGNELTRALEAALLNVREAKALVTSKVTPVTYAGGLEAQRFHVLPAQGFAAGRETQSLANAIHEPPAQSIQQFNEVRGMDRGKLSCPCHLSYHVSASAGFSIFSSMKGSPPGTTPAMLQKGSCTSSAALAQQLLQGELNLLSLVL